jgi:hypothetical protein
MNIYDIPALLLAILYLYDFRFSGNVYRQKIYSNARLCRKQ